jgi:retron-type reverse transcriptase
MTKAKPYEISKQLVWDAYKKVKANRGAAGVDGQSLAAFEKDLKNNLYKIWNRMRRIAHSTALNALFCAVQLPSRRLVSPGV